ncbi:DUF6187 family protein [Amycolatopsis sp. NPDC005003]
MSEPVDSRFALPDVDAPADVEIGVILLGLDADRLLGGLGLARIADDPALVTQLVDQARHGAGGFDLAGLVALGREHWRSLRSALGEAGGTPASLRQEWAKAAGRVAAAVPGSGPASIAYLTACALRRADVDACADAPPDGKEPFDVLPEVPAG